MLLNDGVSDCVEGQDETNLSIMLMTPLFTMSTLKLNTDYPCERGYSLCNPFEQQCYPSSFICVFGRDIYGQPLHCSDTEHLRHCENHVCPGFFKCSKSFCIPVYAVCDEVEDCPHGEDESYCNQFQCQGGLKCKGNESK